MSGKQNKRRAVAKIVGWSVILVALLSVFVIFMVFSRGSFNWFNGGFSIISGFTYPDADKYSVGNAIYTEEISGIDIEWVDGTVGIVVYEGDEIKLVESGVGDRKDDIMRTRISHGVLYVKYSNSGVRWFSGIPSKHLSLYLPQKYADQMNEVNINAVSAGVIIEGDMVCREFDFEGVSGKLNISNLKADIVDIDTVSGNVTISGEIDELDISGVSAKAILDLRSTPHDINMDTVSGDVNMTLYSADGFLAELDSVSGDIRVNSEYIGKTEYVGKIYRHGDGASRFDFESVSGNIKITLK